MRKFFTVINFENKSVAEQEAKVLKERLETGIETLKKFQTGCSNPREAFVAANEIEDVVRDIAAALLCKQVNFSETSFGQNIANPEGVYNAKNLRCRCCGENLPPKIGEVECLYCHEKYMVDAVKMIGNPDDLNIVAQIE